MYAISVPILENRNSKRTKEPNRRIERPGRLTIDEVYVQPVDPEGEGRPAVAGEARAPVVEAAGGGEGGEDLSSHDKLYL